MSPGDIARMTIAQHHTGEILTCWTFPPSVLAYPDPVVVVIDPADPIGAKLAARAGAPLDRITIGTIGATKLAGLLEETSPETTQELRQLRPHSLFVVVLAEGGAWGTYLANDPTTGKLRPLRRKRPESPPEFFDIN